MIYGNSNLPFQSIPLPNPVKICPKNGFKRQKNKHILIPFSAVLFLKKANMLLCKNQLSAFLWKGLARNCQTKVRLMGNTRRICLLHDENAALYGIATIRFSQAPL